MQGKKEHFVDGATPPLPLPKLLASVLLPYYPTRNFDRLLKMSGTFLFTWAMV